MVINCCASASSRSAPSQGPSAADAVGRTCRCSNTRVCLAEELWSCCVIGITTLVYSTFPLAKDSLWVSALPAERSSCNLTPDRQRGTDGAFRVKHTMLAC